MMAAQPEEYVSIQHYESSPFGVYSYSNFSFQLHANLNKRCDKLTWLEQSQPPPAWSVTAPARPVLRSKMGDASQG